MNSIDVSPPGGLQVHATGNRYFRAIALSIIYDTNGKIQIDPAWRSANPGEVTAVGLHTSAFAGRWS
jgi:hypothetical protein